MILQLSNGLTVRMLAVAVQLMCDAACPGSLAHAVQVAGALRMPMQCSEIFVYSGELLLPSCMNLTSRGTLMLSFVSYSPWQLPLWA